MRIDMPLVDFLSLADESSLAERPSIRAAYGLRVMSHVAR
jgi:hypothetical protein